MFERFDDVARRIVILAQDEARKLNHHSIDTEHLLLALVREDHGVAARVLASLGLGYDAILAQVETTAGRRDSPPAGHVPFSEDTERAMRSSVEASLGLDEATVRSEHILLGLVHDDNGATRTLAALGADAWQVRELVLGSLG